MKKVTIDSLCKRSAGMVKVSGDTLIDYFDIASIDNKNKVITGFTTYAFGEAPSRARKLVKKNNIIVSTVRPSLNAIAFFDVETPNIPVVSTGFCVLDCKEDTNPRFLFNFLQSKPFIDEMVSRATGASYPAVSDKIVKSALIPAYSYEKQTEIADILDGLNSTIEKRNQQLSKLDQLVKARFVEMFGDPVRNEKSWPIVHLEEFAEIRIGPFGSLLHKEDYIEGGHALINPSHIVEGKICVDKKLTVSPEKYNELSAYHLKIDDIVLGRRGEMGRCAVVHTSGLLCGTGSMIVRPNNKMKPYFLQTILSSPTYKKIIEDKAVGVTMMNLNVPIVSALPVPLLPLDLQEKFIAMLQKVDKTKMTVKQSLVKLETLKKSLMQEYFG